MSLFENIHFKGTFRDYQQRVLDNADKYLKDGKINIVAAPGSGKTVLGLELICRLKEPCIILSPTTAIRQQWGERFRDLFLDDKTQFETLFSNDLHSVRTINSITYQALYTAIAKVSTSEDGDIDCSDIDMFAQMKKYGIKTICLDEAHHLKNEWQKALEKFIEELTIDVKIISLTATPPYDSEGSEWSRYLRICGEIDEEILVPELVGQNTLCPHQDYVYFNYPLGEEIDSFKTYKENAIMAVEKLGACAFIKKLCKKLNEETDYEKLFSSAKEYIALLVLLNHYGLEINKKLIRQLTVKKELPSFKMEYVETALRFLLDGDLITQSQKNEIVTLLKKYSVFDKGKVSLVLNEKLKRTLISSVGKLESIKQIAKSELSAMGNKLRMLVLTDYIKKENVNKIASSQEFNSVNVVSIFESLRRELKSAKIGVLSGSLVILPESVDLSTIKHKKEHIPDTEYCKVEFSGSTHRSVDFVGKLFEKGELQILVGTKSLLGEGWDSPCINSLILASFVGSFVLSNQMRGRAIRIDKNNPNKSANIWHLVTVEPEYLLKEKTSERIREYLHQDNKILSSYDFDILKRRFDSFMGPNYTSGVIESGIERITAIAPPYDKNGIENINNQMLTLSKNRQDVANMWNGEVEGGKFAVAVETEVPKEKRVPVFTFFNFTLFVFLSIAASITISSFVNSLIPIIKLDSAFENVNILLTVAILLVMAILFFLLFKLFKKMILHITPARSIKTLGTAVYKTMRECDLISPSARVETMVDKEFYNVALYLRNASIHDQNIFNAAMAEMLSPIENPRYIIVAKNIFGRLNYGLSFACPSIIGKKKEYVEVLAKRLKGTSSKFEPIYTHKEEGRRLILNCRKNSYVTLNEMSKSRLMKKKYKVSHWE